VKCTSYEVPHHPVPSSLPPLPPLRPKYSSQHPILKHPQTILFVQYKRLSFTPTQNNRQCNSFIHLYILFQRRGVNKRFRNEWHQASPEFNLLLIYWSDPGKLSGIALGYGLDDREFEFRQQLRIFFFTIASRPVLGTSSFLSNGYRASFPRDKVAGPPADHLHPSSANVKNAWSYTSTPNKYSWHGSQISTGIT
jgi:hypothetical protein